MKSKSLTQRIFTAVAFLALALPASAQLRGLIPGQKKTEPAKNTAAPEFSDKDKAEMDKLSQKPEVASAISNEWEDAKRVDMEVAFAINTRDARTATAGHDRGEAEAVQNALHFGGTYDNPILQDYLNSLGQSLVPKDSPNLYAFRLVLNPVPRAESLTTGTIYVSTGLVALLDNEAQLAYVLGHEIAHVEKMHRFQEIRNRILENALIAEKEQDLAKKRALMSVISVGAGSLIGHAAGNAALGAGIGLAGGFISSELLFRQKLRPTAWSLINENEADEVGLKLTLDRSFDVREVPKAYVRLDGMVQKDARIGLGFMGDKARVRERIEHIRSLLSGAMKADLDAKAQSGLTGSSPQFSLLMAALKRDNGVIALDYDMFPMARANLEDALAIRSNDPRTLYFLGKVVALTGRAPEEKKEAMGYFLKAIEYDRERGSYPSPHLEYALNMIKENNPADRDKTLDALKTYVTLYQRDHAGQLPENMHIIYDYMLLSGDKSWYVPPVANVSTKGVAAINVTSAASAPATAAPAPASAPAAKAPAVKAPVKKP